MWVRTRLHQCRLSSRSGKQNEEYGEKYTANDRESGKFGFHSHEQGSREDKARFGCSGRHTYRRCVLDSEREQSTPGRTISEAFVQSFP